VFATMFDTGKKAREIIAAEGMAQISDPGAIETIARAVIAKNPENLAKYRGGSEGVFKYFVGQVIKESRGQANLQIVNEILKRVLAEA
jgi:Asp-tRNA(Asn)/Glu-tRNA(Gln) amidotransferase B subunit